MSKWLFAFSCGVQQDPDLARLHSLQLDPGDALQPFDASLEMAVQHVVGVRQVAVAGDAQHQDGLVAEGARVIAVGRDAGRLQALESVTHADVQELAAQVFAPEGILRMVQQ